MFIPCKMNPYAGQEYVKSGNFEVAHRKVVRSFESHNSTDDTGFRSSYSLAKRMIFHKRAGF